MGPPTTLKQSNFPDKVVCLPPNDDKQPQLDLRASDYLLHLLQPFWRGSEKAFNECLVISNVVPSAA